jgi:NAD(P)-dependent dehydrogenase (short-subunit alcohol dehydrogenase family)
LFERIEREHGGLDLLVNNASAIPDRLTEPGPFWHKPLALSCMIDVGLRSNYVAAYYAAPLLVAKGAGLLVNISSFGARCYMHGPAYGAVKAANDKMAHDMAHDLRPFGIAAVSLWLGLVKTERTMALCATEPEKYASLLAHAESPEFAGRVIAGLLRNPQRMDNSGQVLIAAELAQEYGISDIDDSQPPSHRAFLGSPPAWNAAVIE